MCKLCHRDRMLMYLNGPHTLAIRLLKDSKIYALIQQSCTSYKKNRAVFIHSSYFSLDSLETKLNM